MEKVGGKEYAEKSLQMIRDHLNIVQEKVRLSSLFSHKMSYIMFIAFAIAFFQQITGINAIFYYAPTIFEKTGGGQESAFIQAIVIGLVNLGFTFVAIWLIDKLGRKPLLLIGTIVMAIALFINAWAFGSAGYRFDQNAFTEMQEEIPVEVIASLRVLENKTYDSKEVLLTEIESILEPENYQAYHDQIVNKTFDIKAMLVLFAIILYIAAFAISLGPVMWALLSEIFPNQLRGLAISVVGLFNSLVSFTVTLVFPWELSNLGTSATFLIYGIFAALAFIFVIRYIPETKGKSLEELESILLKS